MISKQFYRMFKTSNHPSPPPMTKTYRKRGLTFQTFATASVVLSVSNDQDLCDTHVVMCFAVPIARYVLPPAQSVAHKLHQRVGSICLHLSLAILQKLLKSDRLHFHICCYLQLVAIILILSLALFVICTLRLQLEQQIILQPCSISSFVTVYKPEH